MATANSTRHLAGSSLSTQSEEFAGLSRRLLVTVNHVVLVSQHFGDLADLPAEHVAAGMTLCEAHCEVCGAQAPGSETIAEAAQNWNKRGEL